MRFFTFEIPRHGGRGKGDVEIFFVKLDRTAGVVLLIRRLRPAAKGLASWDGNDPVASGAIDRSHS